MRFAIAALAAALASPVCADDIATCKHAAGLAGMIMDARQKGASVKDVIEPVLAATPEGSRRLMKQIVLLAFEQPRFSSPDNQARAVTDYENTTFISCMEAF